MVVPAVRFPIFLVVRLIGITVAALLLTWTLHFRGGLALISDDKDLIFNVHPVLMVIGLVLLNGEGDILGFDILLDAILEAEVANKAKEFFLQPQNQSYRTAALITEFEAAVERDEEELRKWSSSLG